ncbi:hypothetical protein ACFQY7_38880 [Actinomadura luteofluorescens]|uniref:Uncharacterized protein n=1 Tax=Actinomadura luteofluorescens TaxID=46163 RepID=A0A7Y9JII2_9ACTN|nr:hypothetical protein [Actinomadura luteofluorescens]NYD48414.1 hypothetical protein [Actinomadura luteofluorescens]
MPRPCSIHCVMPSECGRAPGIAHHPAFRPAAAATALAIAATLLALAPPRASAATRPSPGPRTAAGAEPPFPAGRLLAPASASRLEAESPPEAASRPETASPPEAASRPETAGLPGAAPRPETAGLPGAAPRPETASRPEAASPAARKRTVPPRDVLPDLPSSQRLDQQLAEYALRASGIGWRSTGRCSDRTVRTCTSFEGIRWGTLRSLIDFAESSGCEVTVTGGTEHGHAGGTYSHANGYKIDIATGTCVDEAVRRYPSIGVRGDGARLHRSPEGVVFAREKDHWDITIRRGPRG